MQCLPILLCCVPIKAYPLISFTFSVIPTNKAPSSAIGTWSIILGSHSCSGKHNAEFYSKQLEGGRRISFLKPEELPFQLALHCLELKLLTSDIASIPKFVTVPLAEHLLKPKHLCILDNTSPLRQIYGTQHFSINPTITISVFLALCVPSFVQKVQQQSILTWSKVWIWSSLDSCNARLFTGSYETRKKKKDFCLFQVWDCNFMNIHTQALKTLPCRAFFLNIASSIHSWDRPMEEVPLSICFHHFSHSELEKKEEEKVCKTKTALLLF